MEAKFLIYLETFFILILDGKNLFMLLEAFL
jgi:hypothetical protein